VRVAHVKVDEPDRGGVSPLWGPKPSRRQRRPQRGRPPFACGKSNQGADKAQKGRSCGPACSAQSRARDRARRYSLWPISVAVRLPNLQRARATFDSARASFAAAGLGVDWLGRRLRRSSAHAAPRTDATSRINTDGGTAKRDPLWLVALELRGGRRFLDRLRHECRGLVVARSHQKQRQVPPIVDSNQALDSNQAVALQQAMGAHIRRIIGGVGG
jgi:hypothetical protein